MAFAGKTALQICADAKGDRKAPSTNGTKTLWKVGSATATLENRRTAGELKEPIKVGNAPLFERGSALKGVQP